MARRLNGARSVRAMNDIEEGLRMLTLGLRRLARDVTSIHVAPGERPASRRPVTRALRLQGRYMGLIRNLPPRKKARVMALRQERGVEHAIKMARALRG
ncbi:MAG TPA: hypothetical protein VMQ62_09885 [Dongiaceae bacterium]|nr:hypothetical protein [Dongiaceae bacterium]